MTPLQITATLAGPVSLPYHPVALDALLAWAVCQRDGIPPALLASELQPVEIPVEREPEGRFHLASVGHYEVERSELRYVNKRAPIEQYQTIGSDKIKRVQITAGANKSYRIPLETVHLVDDRMTWWCIGARDDVEGLLSLVHYLGKRRAAGCGKIARWTVEEMAPSKMWEGFPVVRDGEPLRNLPIDWPAVSKQAVRGYANLSYPYWDRTKEETCHVATTPA